ncbi:MAG: hypothetical protein ABSH28_16935 [Acidobacteriota bacterium]|jgi:hypothetical protein
MTVIVLGFLLPLRGYAQTQSPAERSITQGILDGLIEHLGALFIATLAGALGLYELRELRRAAGRRLEEDKRRNEAEEAHRQRLFTAEETHRQKEDSYRQKMFEVEAAERQNLARFRAEEMTRFFQPTKEIAELLTDYLVRDPHWAARALEKAKVLPYTNTLFGERSEHFQAEKEDLAQHFTPYLLKRCGKLAANGSHVFLLIDAGTTLYSFFEIIGKETMKLSQRGSEWLKRLHLATNNLPGIEQLIKTGRRVPWDRYSRLAIEDCYLLPGIPVPVFAAVAGEETNAAIAELRIKFNKRFSGAPVTFVALVVGNWIRIRRKGLPCPIPMARGTEHQSVKQTFVDHADEIFVVSPLGKIFVDISNKEVNDALGFYASSDNPELEPYQDVEISEELAKRVKLVSTTRAEGHLLHKHSNRLEYALSRDSSSVRKTAGGDEETYASAAIEALPHLLLPFGALPRTKYEEFTVEFPHEHTRTNQRVLEKFQVNRESI